jgi:hypothetical protein
MARRLAERLGLLDANYGRDPAQGQAVQPSKAAALGIVSWAKGAGEVDAALLQDGPV